jgi:hypothetical protein|tara:strand:- start:321 stop:872 length:552 start_codon:yes stop_codon:yes gene_type:complete
MTKPDLKQQLTAADQQAANQADTDKKAAELGALLQGMLDTKPAVSETMTAAPWIGKVEVVIENIALINSFKSTVVSKRFHISMIDALTKAIMSGLNDGKPFEFKNQGEVENFDTNDVCDTHLINYPTKTESDVSRDNDRMIHNWGGQLLGLVPWDLTKQTKKWLAANNLPIKEQKIAFFKVTK